MPALSSAPIPAILTSNLTIQPFWRQTSTDLLARASISGHLGFPSRPPREDPWTANNLRVSSPIPRRHESKSGSPPDVALVEGASKWLRRRCQRESSGFPSPFHWRSPSRPQAGPARRGSHAEWPSNSGRSAPRPAPSTLWQGTRCSLDPSLPAALTNGSLRCLRRLRSPRIGLARCTALTADLQMAVARRIAWLRAAPIAVLTLRACALHAEPSWLNIADSMQKQTAVPLAAAAASGFFCLAIDRYWFDCAYGDWHQPVRDWGLHWVALVCAVMTTLLALQCLTDDSRDALVRARRIAVAVPLLVASLHEGGQWLWPSGHRDAFDSGRDFALNVVGTIVAWAIVARWIPLPAASARAQRRSAPRGN